MALRLGGNTIALKGAWGMVDRNGGGKRALLFVDGIVKLDGFG